ncbi:PKD-like domain-containing protein [Mucilaginibacter sp. SP1R1]|uniref:Ig-like domain-containing protein n=1 Tax=Mucilaginibacter sp. SP1R1 TaxID=2723091 RepID=UPI00161EE971|nr:PKD-like domain-containing protein [Mucilaginibacter sp. SP1R1]MBB6149048.1 gliding motility-associated-like protein [Mucilaginibacter sp. SP1R1]
MNIRLFIFFLLVIPFKLHSQICTLNVDISTTGTVICSGNTVTITATPTGGIGPYNLVWNTGETTNSINVNKAGTYTVTVTDKTAGCQPVIKNISVVVAPSPKPPTAAGQTVCQNTPATLTATGPGGNYQWYDAPTGGNFLGSGSTYTTPPITYSMFFYVQTTVSDCTSPRTAVPVYVAGKPSVTGTTVCVGSNATLAASGGDTYIWYDAATGGNQVGTGPTFTTPPLFNTTTYYVESIVNGCASGRIPVLARVGTPPQPPTATNISVCAGSVASLHADAPAGVLNWFDVPTGGVPLITSPDFTTPPLNATTTYYVQTSLNDCLSSRTPVKVTVNPIPATPAPQTISICSGTSTTLTASATTTGSYQWYDAPEDGHLLTTARTYNTPVLTRSTTYYVLSTSAGCTSDRSAIVVNITPPPTAPSVSGSIICIGSITTLTATSASGGTIEWYGTATGGQLLASNASYTTPALTTSTTYYVQTVLAGCISSRTAVAVTVLPPTVAPTASPVSICAGNQAQLTAFSANGNYAWYDSPTGGTLLSAAQSYVTPVLSATKTYYVQTAVNDCESARTPVTVTVNPPPAVPTVHGTTICSGTSTALTASSSAGTTLNWYTSAVGGSPIASGGTFNTPILSQNTTYYVESTTATCTSARTPVTVTINSADTFGFLYPSGTYGTTGTNPQPIIRNFPSGGVFTAAPAGLVFANNTTGEINLSLSIPGTYIITLTSNGPCGGTYRAPVTISDHPNSDFFYDGPYCQDGINPLPSFAPGSSGGVFTATPGLVFKSASTGEINLSASTPGTYTITNTITRNNALSTISHTVVEIDKRVIVNAGADQTLPIGTPVSLSGSIGGASGGRWAGGTGTFANSSHLSTTYTPGPGETAAALRLTSSDPNNACGIQSDEVIIHFQPGPAAPTVPGTSICQGGSVTLSAIAPGGTYKWFDAPTDGTLLNTGPTYATPALTATTVYYVQTTLNNLTSPRTAVKVTVNQTPIIPTAPPVSICMGQIATLTANSGIPGSSYEWFNAPVGGNRLSLNGTYTTTALTANTSYYVQATFQGCTGPRTQVDIQVNSLANITSLQTGTVCSGNALNYSITADVPIATFSWSRAAVTGISNTAVTGQTSGTITETLINTTTSPIDVTYVVVPFAGECPGAPFDYVVTVYPTPLITSQPTAEICNMTSSNYAITINVPGTSFNWSRAAVAGISNASVSGQTAGTIKEVLFNTTNAPVIANYTFNYNTTRCTGVPFQLAVTVNPTITITSDNKGTACSGSPLGYTIESNIPSATFSWRRAAVTNISNPAVSDQTSATINETLVNTATFPIAVTYVITPTAYGCTGTPFIYNVVVNPQPGTPVANANSPVCLGSTILLRTASVPNATYLWTGPNGYSSTLANPDVSNVTEANAGTYSLSVSLNGCSSIAGTTTVVVNQPPQAQAGPNQLVCTTITSVQLAGIISGGTNTGIWSSSGTGTFSPASNQLNAQYIPSAQDKNNESVKLTLSSTSKDDCTIATSDMTITFGPSPADDAGPDQEVCAQDAAVPLNGKIFIAGGSKWTSSGTGTFSPSADQLDASYIPTKADVQNGSVTITLTATSADQCYIATDDLKIKFTPPPTVNAGGITYVLKNKTVTLNPVVSDDNVQYLWSPNINISNTQIKNPVITGDVDRTYTLQVTDIRGCVTQSVVFVKVSPDITVPNTFTPNGDGYNDIWEIKGLIAYQDAIVDIFNRYGTKLFHSVGYSTPWDGTYNGQMLPSGTYYYIINTKVNNQVLSGPVTILR